MLEEISCGDASPSASLGGSLVVENADKGQLTLPSQGDSTEIPRLSVTDHGGCHVTVSCSDRIDNREPQAQASPVPVNAKGDVSPVNPAIVAKNKSMLCPEKPPEQPVHLRTFLDTFRTPSETQDERWAKDAAVTASVFLVFVNLLLFATDFSVDSLITSVYPMVKALAFFSILLLLRHRTYGVTAFQYVIALTSIVDPVAYWLNVHTGDDPKTYAPALFVAFSLPVTSIVFAVAGGKHESWLGGKGIVAFHLATVAAIAGLDYVRFSCTWLVNAEEGMQCERLYATFGLMVCVCDCGSWWAVGVLRTRMGHERLVALVMLDNCLPRSYSADIKNQVSRALAEAGEAAGYDTLRRNLEERPELIGLRVTATVGKHENISVMFADLVGFTQSTLSMQPEAVVQTLGEIFLEIDWVCVFVDVEKIKTIGDAYMACSKLENSSGKLAAKIGAKKMVQVGLWVTSELRCRSFGGSEELRFRVGINTGSIVGGVIGFSKFSFDVWGDTVNLASRMESSGIPNRVQVSPSTARLADTFHYSSRTIVVKGHRFPLTAYLVDEDGNSTPNGSRTLSSASSRKDAWRSFRRLGSTSSQSSTSLHSPASFSSNPLIAGPAFFKIHPGHRLSCVSMSSLSSNSGSLGSAGSPHRSTRKRPPALQSPVSQQLQDFSLVSDFTPMLSPAAAVAHASQGEVRQWLTMIGLSHLARSFEEHAWSSLDQVVLMQPEDLDIMKITQAGTRRCLLTAVQALRSSHSDSCRSRSIGSSPLVHSHLMHPVVSPVPSRD
ncbi:Adenylate cyclase [Diplonema papillatum]|nr:Adenylate cyclase [Diplonema papillatum]